MTCIGVFSVRSCFPSHNGVCAATGGAAQRHWQGAHHYPLPQCFRQGRRRRGFAGPDRVRSCCSRRVLYCLRFAAPCRCAGERRRCGVRQGALAVPHPIGSCYADTRSLCRVRSTGDLTRVGADYMDSSGHFDTLLHLAAGANQVNLVQWLLQSDVQGVMGMHPALDVPAAPRVVATSMCCVPPHVAALAILTC